MEKIYCFVVQTSDGERMAAVRQGGVTLPLLVTEESDMDFIKRNAQMVADLWLLPVKMYAYLRSEEIETFRPSNAN